MGLSQTAKSKLTAEERRLKAIELRRAGMTFEGIGKELSCSKQRAYQIVSKYMNQVQERCNEEVEAMRLLEAGRLDEAQHAIWEKVRQGDIKAVRVFLQLSARRAKLFGLDSPIKIAPTDPSGENPYAGMSDEELLGVLKEAIGGCEKS